MERQLRSLRQPNLETTTARHDENQSGRNGHNAGNVRDVYVVPFVDRGSQRAKIYDLPFSRDGEMADDQSRDPKKDQQQSYDSQGSHGAPFRPLRVTDLNSGLRSAVPQLGGGTGTPQP
jgi:hypothetical protein